MTCWTGECPASIIVTTYEGMTEMLPSWWWGCPIPIFSSATIPEAVIDPGRQIVGSHRSSRRTSWTFRRVTRGDDCVTPQRRVADESADRCYSHIVALETGEGLESYRGDTVGRPLGLLNRRPRRETGSVRDYYFRKTRVADPSRRRVRLGILGEGPRRLTSRRSPGGDSGGGARTACAGRRHTPPCAKSVVRPQGYDYRAYDIASSRALLAETGGPPHDRYLRVPLL